jgi:chromate transporter
MIYLKLFWSFFQIGLLSFGGGYASLPLIQKQIVQSNHWLSMSEFVDVLTISQMTPGPIGINASTFVGVKTAGILGAVFATLGFVTPSCIIVITLACLYYKYKSIWLIQGALSGLRPAVVALIAFSGLSIVLLSFFGVESMSFADVKLSQINIPALLIFAVSFIVMRKFKPNPVLIMAGAGAVGLVMYLINTLLM